MSRTFCVILGLLRWAMVSGRYVVLLVIYSRYAYGIRSDIGETAVEEHVRNSEYG